MPNTGIANLFNLLYWPYFSLKVYKIIPSLLSLSKLYNSNSLSIFIKVSSSLLLFSIIFSSSPFFVS